MWIVAMFFFMLILALGYLYVLGLSRLRQSLQVLVQGVLLGVTLFVLFSHEATWPSAITPRYDSIGLWSHDAVLALLSVLTFSVGLPFFLLSTTSSLLQSWYGNISGKEPFSLYSLSNVGSLLGLLSYPFVFEPFLSTPAQGHFWTYGFLLYTFLLCGVCLLSVKSHELTERTPQKEMTVSVRQFWRWVLLAAIPVAAMVTGTRQLTTDIAPLPLLWVLPIALYLISFIVSFQKRSFLKTTTVEWLMLGACFLGLLPLAVTFVPSVPAIVMVLGALFAVYHLCHEMLYRERPDVSRIALYYTALSLGGIVGSLTVMISSLYLLVIPIEFVSMLVVAGIFISYQKFVQGGGETISFLRSYRVYVFALSLSGLLFFAGGAFIKNMHESIFQARNFFGHKSVTEYETERGVVRTLIHGLTNHGLQVMSGEAAGGSASYYGPGSGVGKTIETLRMIRGDVPLRVAVIGMGGGVLATYCQSGDQFSFFEIDSQVVEIAKRFFTYLDRCPNATIAVEDGRIGMERSWREGGRPYDIIIIDAYADDTVPAHLLTLEAATLYQQMLASDGLLAIHISSRHLDLGRVVAGYTALGLFGRFVHELDPPFPYFESQWAVFAQEQTIFERAPFSGEAVHSLDNVVPVQWTDTTNSLLPLIRY